MTIDCFSNHVAYLKEWRNGIAVCLLCAAKHELAQDAKTALLQAKILYSAHNLSYDSATEEREDDMQKTKCPKCGSLYHYFRLKSGEFVCRACGHHWKK